MAAAGGRGATTTQHYIGTSDRVFALSCWAEGNLRADARRPQQLRELLVEYPLRDRNHAVVTLGRTVATACVAVEMVDPSPYGPKNGFFDIVVRGPDATMATAQQRAGSSSALGDVRSALESMLKTGGAVDTEALCILPGRHVWSLQLTVTLLTDDGNAVDAALWAATAALRHARRPDLTITTDTVTVHSARDRDPVPLALHHIPIAVSAALLPGGFVLDPSTAEAGAASCCLTVALTPSMQVCAVHKRRGAPCDYAVIQAVIAVAKSVVCGVEEIIVAAMKADEARRKEAARAQFEWAQKRTGIARRV
jgi:exosome complex component RRP45